MGVLHKTLLICLLPYYGKDVNTQRYDKNLQVTFIAQWLMVQTDNTKVVGSIQQWYHLDIIHRTKREYDWSDHSITSYGSGTILYVSMPN